VKKLICQNCSKPVAEEHLGCLLHDLIQVARERGNTPERKLRKIHSNVDADGLWNTLGRIVDDLERGEPV
jgi:hypothetical protein